MKEFSHDNLIKYYDSWYDENESYFYIAMQLCKTTLDQFIENNSHVHLRNPPQSTNVEILDILKQITEAVDYLHNRVKAGSGFSNIAHRDLKPQNILIGEKNTGRRDWVVVLADFGLSTEISNAKARSNLTRGVILRKTQPRKRHDFWFQKRQSRSFWQFSAL